MIRVRCPICDRAMEGQGTSEWPDFPFCSPRCKLIDLGRWLGEEYKVESDPEGETAPPEEEISYAGRSPGRSPSKEEAWPAATPLFFCSEGSGSDKFARNAIDRMCPALFPKPDGIIHDLVMYDCARSLWRLAEVPVFCRKTGTPAKRHWRAE
jgi:endogenous inhibitor of DNA gyrase (YacG/DUF329 family)